MTHTIVRTAFAASFAAGLVLAAGAAVAADLAEPKTDIEGGQVVLVGHEVEVESWFIPKGGSPTKDFPEGEPGVGDAFAFTNEIRQGDPEIVVGTDKGTCTIVENLDAVHCDVTATFPGGTLRIVGDALDGPFTLPIESGTGAYAGIKGTVTVVDHSEGEDDDSSDLTFTYRLPAEATQVGAVPAGGAQTGGGLGTDGMPVALFAIGAAAIVTGAGIAGLGRRVRG